MDRRMPCYLLERELGTLRAKRAVTSSKGDDDRFSGDNSSPRFRFPSPPALLGMPTLLFYCLPHLILGERD
jgi:hypothetical protein